MNPRLPVSAASALIALAIGAAPLAAASNAPAEPLGTLVSDTVRVPGALAKSEGLGWSGSVRVAVVRALDALDLPFVAREQTPDGVAYRWVPLFGTRGERVVGDTPFRNGLQAPSNAGIWQLLLRRGEADEQIRDLAVITEVPFTAKQGGFLNGYHIGRYPTEGLNRTDRYAPPGGFIEVTPENKDLPISEHFRLAQFLTKDQFNVWPKYVALDMRLIDKLELVLQELNAMGIRADHMHVMSGYRTPQYNGPGEGGRARLSRHTYGDAADVWVDNDRDGYVDDLNGDGQRDIQDILLILRAVDRVEQRYPELIGGAGVYLENSAHGPFIHIDVRGEPTRW